MVKPIEIEVLGHKATVGTIEGVVEGGSYSVPVLFNARRSPNDVFSVWVCFDEAVDGILRFGVFIPVKEYSKDELLTMIKSRAEKRLEQIIDQYRDQAKHSMERQARKNELDQIAQGLLNLLRE